MSLHHRTLSGPELRPAWILGALAVLACLATALPLSAQDTATGSLLGKVVDAEGLPLPGAAVSVDGTGLSTETARDGSFELGRVPTGSRALTVSYLGLAEASATIVVSAGQVAQVTVTLDEPAIRDEVTVLASPILHGQAKALNQQRTAANIQNIVSADQLGRFPDSNSAEATQRIPGITLQRDQGEGRYVIVRGTEARLNAMTINGERIPSPEGDVRQVALDVIPADLLEAIEVSKALTPDMDGDAIGGAVNLVTKRAPENRRLFVTAGGGYNDISDDGLYTGNVVYGQRFGEDNRYGLLLAGSTMETDRGSDNFEVEYDDGELEELQLRDYTITRERDGLNADLDIAVNDSSEVRLRGVWNEFADQEFRRRLVSKVGDGELEREMKDRFEVQEIRAAVVEGNHLQGNGAVIDWRLSYAYADEEEPGRLDSNFIQEDVEFAPNVTPDSIDPDNIRSNPLNQDLALFVLDEIVREDNLTTEEDVVAAVNVAVPYYRDAGLSGLFKFGAKYRGKEKDRNNEVFEVDIDDLTLPDVLDDFDAAPFFDGRYQIGRFPSAGALRDFASDFDLERDAEEDLADYETSEDTTAVYGLADLQIGDKLSLVTGLRWESTDSDFSAFEILFDEEGDLAGLTPVRGGNDYDVLLPSAHLRYALSTNSNVRAALSRSLARPDFVDLAPAELILEEDLEIERGNPDLDVTTAWNLDLMYEKYFESVGVFSAGIFYKLIESPIYRFVFDELRGGEEFEVIQPRNGEDADLLGFEVVYQNRLRHLRGWASGIGFYFNYTYTDSEATFPIRADTRFPGQAENVGNFALSYERGGFSGRLSFNYHDEYLTQVGEGPAEDLWIDEHLQIDFSATQRLTDKLRLFVEVVNLGDEPFRVYEGTPDRPIQEEIYSWWATVGIKLEL